MTKYLCVQFNEKCAVCPMKISFITRFCKHHLGCTIPRYVKRKIHEYSKDLKLANELINKFAFSVSGSIHLINDEDDSIDGELNNEQKDYALKVLI